MKTLSTAELARNSRRSADRRLRDAAIACVERLETRVLFNAVTYTVADGGDHALLLQMQGSSLVLSDNGVVQFSADPSTVSSLAITGAGGSDVLTIDSSNGSAIISGGITFDGAGGANRLVLQGGSFGFEVYAPTSGTSGNISIGGGNVTYANLAGITDTSSALFFSLNTSSATEQVNVLDGPVVGGMQTTDVNGGASPQFVATDFANKRFATVNTIGGSDVVTLNNPAGSAGMGSFTLDTYQGADTVNVLATAPGFTTTITSTGGFSIGDDAVVVGNNGSTQGILGQLVITNSPGLNDIVLDDSADPTGRLVSLDNTFDPNLGYNVLGVTGLSPALIEIDPMAANLVTMNGGFGGNTFNVQTDVISAQNFLNTGAGDDITNIAFLPGNSPLTIDGQGGSDAVNVAVTVQNGYPSLLGLLTVNNRGGATALSVDTTGETSAQTVNLGAGVLTISTTLPTGTTTSTIDYSLPFGSLSVMTGSAADAFSVSAVTVPTTLDGGAGGDSYAVDMSGLTAALSILDSGADGVDSATLTGLSGATSYTVGPNQTAGNNWALVNYDSNLESLSLSGGSAADSFVVIPSAATAFTLNGAAPTTAPGDSISVQLNGAADAALDFHSDTGQGTYTFSNRLPVNFVNMESAAQPGQMADLALAYTAPSTVLENGQLTYSFSVTNNGPASATNVVLTASIPGGASFQSALLGQGTFALSDGSVVLNLGTMADGATVSGTITFLAGDEGAAAASTASVSSDVTDPNSADNSGSASAMVLDAPLTATGGLQLSAVEGQMSLPQTVATFVDSAVAEALSDYQAMINWGDNSSSAGTITYDPNTNTFTVSGSHLYAEEGSYTASVVLTHDAAPSVTVSDEVAVADQAVLATGGLTLSGSEGSSASLTLATFTDPGGAEGAADYVATIDWGDQTSSLGSITFDPSSGQFTVSGSHTYASAGNYTASVSIAHDSASPTMVSDAVSIADPAVAMTGGFTLSATEGATSSSQLLATFTDSGGAESVSHYSAAITWGDGSSSAGAVSYNASTGVFSVSGGHKYATAGSYPITVVVHHDSAPDARAAGSAIVVDPAVVAAGGFTLNSSPNSSTGLQTLATFTDPGGAEDLSHYSAAVNWGDGTSGAGALAYNASTGVFTVQGAHTYGGPGGYPITVTIHHDTAADVTVSDAAQVASKGAPKLSKLTMASINEGGTAQLTGNVSTPGGGGPMTLTVNWGPGQGSSSMSLPANASNFSISHKYVDNPLAPATSYPVSLTLTDSNGTGTAAITGTVKNVAPTAGALTGPTAVVRGQSFQLAGSFTDPGVLDTHTVKFVWGDGSNSAGSVTESNGSGTFNGTHVFTASGTYNVACTITDKDGGATTITQTITVSAILVENDPVFGGTMLALGGTTGNDTISLKSNKGGRNLKVSVNADSADVPSSAGRVVVFTQGGSDNVQFAKDVMTPAFVYSGAGNKMIVGGGGPDVFVGGPGNDVLVGGSSRNILIGGRGSDMLVGGGADDILVAGYTSLDNNDAALAAVFNEWNRATVPAATRINDLSKGGGLNGSVVLNNSTVFNDNAVDMLIGGGGSDWILSSNNDLILGRATGTLRTKI